MRATVMFGAGDVRVETVPDARLVDPTDALVVVTRAAICGSDLWPYQTMEHSETGRRMGHEFIGVVEAVGAEVRTVKAGEVVVAPFLYSDGTCVFCREGLHTSCIHGGRWGGDGVDAGQGEAVRVPEADGTLVVLPVGAGRRADAVAAHALGRDGHGPPRGSRRQGRPGQDGGRRRRRRRRPVRRDRGAAPRRRADRPPGPSSRPDRAGQGVRRHRHRERARRRGCRARTRADRRLRRALRPRVRRPRTVDCHRPRHRPSRRRGRPCRPSPGSDDSRDRCRPSSGTSRSAAAPPRRALTSRSSCPMSWTADRARPGLRPRHGPRRGARRLPGDERPRGDQGDDRALELVPRSRRNAMQKRTLGQRPRGLGDRPRLHGDEPELPADSRTGTR